MGLENKNILVVDPLGRFDATSITELAKLRFDVKETAVSVVIPPINEVRRNYDAVLAQMSARQDIRDIEQQLAELLKLHELNFPVVAIVAGLSIELKLLFQKYKKLGLPLYDLIVHGNYNTPLEILNSLVS